MKIFPAKFTVAAIAPAGRVPQETLDAGVKILQTLGADVKVMPHVLDGNPDLSFLAARDDARISDLENAWLDPEVDLIWAIRGGYGCARMLSQINWERLAVRNMPLAGFSDITALHWAMTAKKCGIPCAFPMFKYLSEYDGSMIKMLAEAFSGKKRCFTLPALRGGSVSGYPLAGNLTVAASLCGTPFFPDTADRILFLEEISEYPYRIDRTLNQLLMAGAFDRCAGVVFGHFTNSGKPEEIMAVLRDFTRRVSVPVFHSFQYGHELPFVSLQSDREVTINSL